MNIFDIYAIVGTNRNESYEAQRAAYRARCMVLHPDRNPAEGGGAQFADLNAAWSRIKNPQVRAKLDMEYRMLGDKCVACSGDGVYRKQLSFTRCLKETCPSCKGCGYVYIGRSTL